MHGQQNVKICIFESRDESAPCSSDSIQADDVKRGLSQKLQIGQQVFDKYRAMCYGDTQLPTAMLGSF
jgi:hypothetical protein